VVDLLVDRAGIYRVTHEHLAASGFDFSGVSASALALSLLDRPVPIRVGGPARFGRGSFVEFVGDPATGVYTRTNVYRLAVDPARARRVLPPPGPAAGGARTPADAYTESAVVDQNVSGPSARAKTLVPRPGDRLRRPRWCAPTRSRSTG
jgi:hypothetical protein